MNFSVGGTKSKGPDHEAMVTVTMRNEDNQEKW